MKQATLLAGLFFLTMTGWAQPAFYQNALVTIADGGLLYIGGEYVSNKQVNNGGEIYVEKDLINTAAQQVFPGPYPVGSVVLSGSAEQAITGNWAFHELRIHKPSGKVMLSNNISVDSSLRFVQGNLYINEFIIDLKTEGKLSEEANNSRIYAGTGYVTTTRTIQAPLGTEDIAGLGIFLHAPTKSFGTTTIRRGNTVIPEAGDGSITRYFDVIPSIPDTIKTITARYFDTDTFKNERLLQFYSLKDQAVAWLPKGGVVDMTTDLITSPYYRKLGIERITIAPASSNASCAPSNPAYVEAIFLVASEAYRLDTLFFVNVAFSLDSTAGMDAIWNFGDGSSALSEDASHIYTVNGTYTTMLQVSNGVCSDLKSKDVTITEAPASRGIGTAFGEILNSFKYYPNPVQGDLNIEAELSDVFPSYISISDIFGRRLFTLSYDNQHIKDTFSMQELAAGVYIMQLESMGKRYAYKLIKE